MAILIARPPSFSLFYKQLQTFLPTKQRKKGEVGYKIMLLSRLYSEK